jgi:hypothetical protein
MQEKTKGITTTIAISWHSKIKVLELSDEQINDTVAEDFTIWYAVELYMQVERYLRTKGGNDDICGLTSRRIRHP